MRKLLIAVTLITTLAACAELTSLRSAVGRYGEQASNAALHDALWTICAATPVGAIKRRFNTPERIAIYAAICDDSELLIPLDDS